MTPKAERRRIKDMETLLKSILDAKDGIVRGLTKRLVIVYEQDRLKTLVRVYGKCKQCGSTEHLTLDHIIPVQWLTMLGIDPYEDIDVGNYQLLCKPCNMFKGNRIDVRDAETRRLLRKYLDIYEITHLKEKNYESHE